MLGEGLSYVLAGRLCKLLAEADLEERLPHLVNRTSSTLPLSYYLPQLSPYGKSRFAENQARHTRRAPDMLHARHEAGVFLAFLAFPVPCRGCFRNITLDSITMSSVPDI
jgi:hypothetical protein